MNIPQSNFPRVVIIGGGFAGIALAKQLRGEELQVVLIDKHNYHNFQPLMYQVSTGGLEPDSIAYPLRKVLHRYNNFFFRLAHVETVDPEKQCIHTNIGKLDFDYLVVATGSCTNFFGNTNLEKHAMSMKTIPEALQIRSLILENFEQAVLTNDLQKRNALMRFVIVGGGPTGVELAGALAEIKKGILPKDYPDLDIRKVEIELIQSGDRILPGMSEKASSKAEEFLEDLGVRIWKNTRVTDYDGHTVKTKTDLEFEAATLIWAAGVQGACIQGLDAENLMMRGNRLAVNKYNQLEGYDSIFAIGDIACMASDSCPRGHAMMAQPAMQQGKHLGKNLRLLLRNKPMKPFQYKDKGVMATIGRNKAVVDLKNFKLQGIIAWYVWMFIHLYFLIGFRNRAIVFINWVYNYIRFDREARVIIRPYQKDYSEFR
ncbi:MAG: NAD(P)/FAD-dependent oxidoreductase [Flavobacteriaceae bacterium]|nr:NAD(P)/FAD-dependent oxidoreductase [Flavobacteriaceae bacterium]